LSKGIAHNKGQHQYNHDRNKRKGVDFWARGSALVLYALHAAAYAVCGVFLVIVLSAVVHGDLL